MNDIRIERNEGALAELECLACGWSRSVPDTALKQSTFTQYSRHDCKVEKKNWFSWLQGPWLWAWYCGIVIGNILAFATVVGFLVTGDIWGLILVPFLWSIWVIVTTLIVTPILGIVFTCGVVVAKSTLAAYRALPFTVTRRTVEAAFIAELWSAADMQVGDVIQVPSIPSIRSDPAVKINAENDAMDYDEFSLEGKV